MISFVYLFAFLLLAIGISGAVFKKNLIKVAMAINIISNGVNLFLISLGYRAGGAAPIFTNAAGLEMVLPTPQALILTNIVINLAVTAFLVSLAALLSRKKHP